MAWDVRRFGEIDSTNRWLLEQARAGAPEGLVAVADHQTAGRGRLGRTWEAPPGANLLASILLRPPLPPDRLHLVTAAVAVAAADAVEVQAGWRPGIKWPNDLVVDDRKLAGVLAEAELPAVVVGVGLNVTWAPEGAAMVGGGADRDALLAGLLAALPPLLDDWDAVARRYRAECVTVGRQVRVELPGEAFTGTAVDVTPEGHLAVDDVGMLRVVSAGDVIHLRPAAGT